MRASFLLTLLLATLSAAAADVAPTIHRVQACDPPDGRVCKARSTNGGFEVTIPMPFNDFELAAATENGVPLVTYTVGAKTKEGVRYVALCMALERGEMPGQTEEEVKKEFAGRKVQTRPVTLPGVTGFDVIITDGDTHAVMRMLHSSCCQYLISVEYPPSEKDFVEDQIEPFLSSFRVVGCPKIVAECGK